ncbi:RIC1 protein [Cooperia oncophora]
MDMWRPILLHDALNLFGVQVVLTLISDVVNRVGSVSDIEVLTNGGAFVAVWSSKTSASNGGEAGTSPLPATLAVFTPFGTQTWCSLESIIDSDGTPTVSYTSVDWGPEGYHLWLGRSDGLSILPMARSAALCNPIMDHSNHIVLICSSRVLISSNREREGVASAPHAVWTAVNPLHEYIASNWPIRFAAIDRESAKHLVVAGLRGLAHCSLPGVRWKIFGNENQESSLMVTGGVLLWGGTVGAACYDLEACREQLRFYPINKKLDNRFASIFEMECRVIMMSLRSDALVTFDIEGRIIMHRLMRNEESSGDIVKISVDRIAEIRVGDLVTHPACLVSIHLTQLSLDPTASSFFPGVDTVLINVSGRLLTLNPHKVTKDVEPNEPFQLSQPIMVASFVEQVWHCRALTDREPPGLPHLLNALWIKLLHRNSEVFAHHILRQLLKRNLGVFALEVASACRHLPHFAHSLELLLHGVLEEEATSSEPIPDPLLPRCVAFIQEFPEFLRTVAHCARKTELALWSSLFAVTGSPNDLFEVCLYVDGQLHYKLQSLSHCAIRVLRIRKQVKRTPPPMRTSSSRRHATSINSVAEADDLVFARFQGGARITKVRHSHADNRELNRKDSAGSGKRATRVGYFVSALDLDVSRILVSSRKFVQNFPNALTRLHSQFAWPYPVASKKVVDQLEKRFGSMKCSQSAACLNGASSAEVKKASVQSIPVPVTPQEKTNIRIGSSSPSSDHVSIEDAHLVPIQENGNNNIMSGSILGSPSSSTVENVDSRSIGSDWHGLKFLVGETSNKGSAESLAQMSHLMTWFSSAGCLDWIFLICVVSRDVLQLRREINSESVKKAGVEAFKHTVSGCGRTS